MFIILEVNYVVGNANDVTTIDALHWMNIHIYVMQNWKHVPILLMVERVEVGGWKYGKVD